MIQQPKSDIERKIEDYTRCYNLYDIAISTHRKTIADAKRGVLNYSSISDPKLMGLLNGDLKKLISDKEKTGRELDKLRELLKRPLPSPPPAVEEVSTLPKAPVTDPAPAEASIDTGIANGVTEPDHLLYTNTVDPGDTTSAEELDKPIEESSDKVSREREQSVDQDQTQIADDNPPSDSHLVNNIFSPDLSTPDIFSDKEITETLEQLGCDPLD